ncbi:MAG TPA: helix-turn-helix domain-containing protein [Blastocatellia bacterium]|nr:helix-turn-helix domain-containing protein [Blastocatellia bacterium]
MSDTATDMRETAQIIDALAGKIKSGLARPIYLQVIKGPKSEVTIKQVEFLTPAQLAELAHVSPRTVYSWIERASENGLKYYKPPGSSGILFALDEVLEWIRAGEVG